MPGTALAQLYLSLEAGEAGTLEALMEAARPACVRLRIEDSEARDVAAACRAICHARDVPLLIAGPDEAALAVARAAGADGVHLTGAPKAAPWARRELGADAIVGIDPGPSRHDAMIAAETGADYVSLSPDWEAGDALPEAVAWWAAMIETPMVVETARSPGRARILRHVAEFVVAGADEAAGVAEALSGD